MYDHPRQVRDVNLVVAVCVCVCARNDSAGEHNDQMSSLVASCRPHGEASEDELGLKCTMAERNM